MTIVLLAKASDHPRQQHRWADQPGDNRNNGITQALDRLLVSIGVLVSIHYYVVMEARPPLHAKGGRPHSAARRMNVPKALYVRI